MKFDEVVSYYQISAASNDGVACWNITSNTPVGEDSPIIEEHTFLLVVEDLCNGQHTSSNVAMTFMFNSASNDE